MRIKHIYELFAINGAEFITAAYRNLLGREPDPHGMAYYLGRLARGHGKASVIVQLAQAPEARSQKEILGLKKLIADEQRAQHWFWGRFTQRQRHERLLRQNVEELTRVGERVAQLQGSTSLLERRLDELQMETERLRGGLCESEERLAEHDASASAQAASQQALNPIAHPLMPAEQLPWAARSIYHQLLQQAAGRA